MTRLPAVGGDYDSWGTVLNDYLTETSGVAALASSPSVGATTFDVAVVPSGLVVGAIVIVDAFTTQAETRTVTNVSGNTITIGTQLGVGFRFAHDSGDTVLVVTDYRVPIRAYGLQGTAADNWAPFQRMVIEANACVAKIVGSNAILGALLTLVRNPVMCPTSITWENIGLTTDGSYAPADPEGAVVMVAQSVKTVSATASDNVFTITDGTGTIAEHDELVNAKVVFNDPYGLYTLPGGVVSGQTYYVREVLTATTFTISDTQGGAEKNITSDGGAFFWDEVEGLARVYWDNIRIEVNKSDVCGVRMSLQQPGYIRNIRITANQTASAPDTVYGMVITGQIGYVDNVMLQAAATITGMKIGGTGIVVRGFNIVGGANGIEINANTPSVYDVWCEYCSTAGITINGGRGINIGGTWMYTGNTGIPALVVTTLDVDYTVCPIYMLSGTGQTVLSDTARSLTLMSTVDPRGSDHRVVTAYASQWPGWTQPGSLYGAGIGASPVFRARYKTWVDNTFNGGTYKVRYVDEYITCSQSGATDVEMPSNSQDGWRYTIDHASGAGTVTVTTEGSETIDGQASITVALGECVTLLSYGGNYTVIEQHFHTTPQTYTATNVLTDRAYDANATTLDELADVLGTLIADLRAQKVVS